MICEDVSPISLLFCMEAIYRIGCLLAHSVIHMNGWRPKAALVGGRPKAALADERLIVAHSFVQGLWSMVYQPSSVIATFATESRVSRLHLTCHKHKTNISFGPPLAGLNF